jgi:hypothetical protein
VYIQLSSKYEEDWPWFRWFLAMVALLALLALALAQLTNEAILSHPKLVMARIDLLELIEGPSCPLEAFQAT